MDISEIVEHYPNLFHMAESGSWKSIKKKGLLSTSALLDLYKIQGIKRTKIESNMRPNSVSIEDRRLGIAVIRDQKPLPESKLEGLLDDMTTKQFYKLLNQKTFFWVRKERLERLLKARAYRNKSHDVLTIQTEKLVKKYKNKIWLSSINSGSAIFKRGRRGKNTFKRIEDFPFEEMKKMKKEDAIVELAIDYAVKDISKYVVKVEEWNKGKKIKTIWEK